MPVAVGGRGRTVTGPRDRVAAAECQWRIDGQRPVTEWGGTSAVSGRAQVGIAISDGYLHTGGLGFAPGRIGGHDLVRLIPGCAASRGSGRRSLPGLWRGSPTNDLASRPTRTGRTPTHSHSGQFMTRMHPNPISRFHRHPLRLGPAPHSPHRALPAIGPPPAIVTIGSIPAILILASDSLTPYLVTASACLPSSLSPSWWHLLSRDTIPQVGSVIANWLPTGRHKLGRRRPVSSNGPLFRRDDGL